MEKNRGLRTIAILFWVVGSIFWVMIAVLSGDLVTSLIQIAIGWIVLLIIFWVINRWGKN